MECPKYVPSGPLSPVQLLGQSAEKPVSRQLLADNLKDMYQDVLLKASSFAPHRPAVRRQSVAAYFGRLSSMNGDRTSESISECWSGIVAGELMKSKVAFIDSIPSTRRSPNTVAAAS